MIDQKAGWITVLWETSRWGDDSVNAWNKAVRGTAAAALFTLSLSTFLSGGALAKSIGTGSGDKGGNGEGTLLIYGTQQGAIQGGKSVTSLTVGQTYYFVLANPGGQTSEQNLHNVPSQLAFNFYSPPAVFQGNPNKAQQDSGNIQYTVSSMSEVNKHPFVYKVTIPSSMAAGDYTIATFGLSKQPQSNGNNGEDEFFFATDPTVNDSGNGSGGITVNPPVANDMPETPWAGALPLAVAGLGGAAWMYARRRKLPAR